jgi:hypothetical protein
VMFPIAGDVVAAFGGYTMDNAMQRCSSAGEVACIIHSPQPIAFQLIAIVIEYTERVSTGGK